MTMKKPKPSKNSVVYLNAKSCGIYKDGGTRYKVDPSTGKRTKEVDNELADLVTAFLKGESNTGINEVSIDEVLNNEVLVPRYYDVRWDADFAALIEEQQLEVVTIGELQSKRILSITGGHGSPGNDQRTGHIPYVKVSDIRALRVNINPTNLLSQQIAEGLWGGNSSELKAWDLITPNRASSNIGEFAVLLPGEENVVLTKEMFVIRIAPEDPNGWDAFYLLWALCLKSVRKQWQRITLMQTNREDVGGRYKEVRLPAPKSAEWAAQVSKPFRDYFTTIARARSEFMDALSTSKYEFIASVSSLVPVADDEKTEELLLDRSISEVPVDMPVNSEGEEK